MDYFINTGTIQVKEERNMLLMLENVIYMDLRIKCENKNWDIEELNYICHGLNSNCEDLELDFLLISNWLF